MCSPPILIFLFLSFTHLPSPPLSHSARRPSPFIPSPPSHSPSPPLSPPLPSLPSGGEIHARPAGRRGSSTAGRRGSSVWDIHARELDHGHRGSSTAAGAGARRGRDRGGRHTGRSPPTLPLPSLLLSPASSNAGSPSSLPAASLSSLTLQIRSGGGNGKLAASVAASGAASAAAVGAASAVAAGAARSGAVPCESASVRCGAPPLPFSRLPLTSPPLSSPAGRD